MAQGWLGPIFRVHRGQRVRIRFKNLIPQESIVHWMVIMRFADHKGLYLYHCHNLEHEDLGMMRNYLVLS